MIIPKLHYIAQGNSSKELLGNIQKACASGIELVQLGWTNISDKKALKLAQEAKGITAHFQTRLLINKDYKIAKAIKADGVHLEKADPCPSIVRKQLYTWQMIGGTANTIQDCEALLVKQVDYISLTPFKSTTLNDDSAAVLGLKGYAAIIDSLKTNTPIIAAGGITTAAVKDLLETGISGIAVSEEITRDFNAIKIFSQLLSASSIAEQRHTFE